MVFQCFISSEGIPSLPGALPEAKLSMALLSSSRVGSVSSSSLVGSHSTASRAEGDTMFSEVEVEVVFHPSLQLVSFFRDNFHGRRSEGSSLVPRGGGGGGGGRPSAFLMPSYISLMFPVMAADWIFSLSSAQYLLLLAISRICRFLSLAVRLYFARAAHLASMTGTITVDLASNQSCDFEDLFSKVAKAVQYIVSRRASHFSVAVTELLGSKFLLDDLSELLQEVWLRHLADIDTRDPLCLCAMEFGWLHPDVTAHQGVICIAVHTVVRACVENILDSSTPDQE